MTRLEKLEAVAEAVRDWAKSGRSVPRALYYALAALDADAEAQTGETVEVRAAVVFYSPTNWIVRGEAGWDDKELRQEAQGRGRPLAAVITARVPLPVAPTITATVTKERGA